MMLEVSTASYLMLCALVRDALEVESDAAPMLERVAAELAKAVNGEHLPDELKNDARIMTALAEGGFVTKAA